MMPADFITAETVASLIGLPDAAALHRQRARLTAEHAFPLPMPTSLRPLRWRRDEVAAWVARHGTPQPPAPVIQQGSNVYLLNLARSA